MEEIWKPVFDYEWYQISNLWRIKSMNYGRMWIEKIILPWKSWQYARIDLSKNWKRKSFNIHRLVAIHFIENPLNLPLACHKDETLDDRWMLYNWADNLYWWSYSDNNKEPFTKWRANNHLQLNHPFKWKFWKDNPWSKKVVQISISWFRIKEFNAINEAERELWISHTMIISCCKWKQKTAGWYKWE